MSPRIDPLAGIRRPLRAVTAAGWTATMLAVAEAHRTLVHRSAAESVFDAYVRFWASGILAQLGVRVVVDGLSPVTSPRPCLIVCNHRSALDIPILLRNFGGSVVSRDDLANWPLIGLAARRAQTIFVNRSCRSSGAQAIRKIREQLSRARTVSIFPEGGVFGGDEVRPFAAGALAAARGLDVDVLPVGVAYPPGTEFLQDSFVEHAKDLAGRRRLTVALQVGLRRRLSDTVTAAGKRTPRDYVDVGETLRREVQTLVIDARTMLPASD